MDLKRTASREEQGRRESLLLMKRLMVGCRTRLDEALKPKKVTTAQLRLLGEVKARPGATGAQLARACYVTPQSAQALTARAVERGWLVRGTDAENGRLVTLRLTAKGERLLEHADAALRGLERELWKGVSRREMEALQAVLERALKNLEG